MVLAIQLTGWSVVYQWTVSLPCISGQQPRVVCSYYSGPIDSPAVSVNKHICHLEQTSYYRRCGKMKTTISAKCNNSYIYNRSLQNETKSTCYFSLRRH